MSKERGLTGNEVAQCLGSVQIHQTWWDKNNNGSDFGKKEMAKLKALNAKLSAMLDEAFPMNEDGECDDSKSDDVLLFALDEDVIGKLSEALKEMQIDYCDQMCRDRPVDHMHECEKATTALALLQESSQ